MNPHRHILPILLQSIGGAAFGWVILVLPCGCNRQPPPPDVEVKSLPSADFHLTFDAWRMLIEHRNYDALFSQRKQLEETATSDDPQMAAAAFAALMTVDGHIDPAWELAWGTPGGFSSLLAAMPLLVDGQLRVELAVRSLPLLDDESLSLLSGWPEEDRLAAREAVIAALVYVPGHEAEIREALVAAQQDSALQATATEALDRIAAQPPAGSLLPARQLQKKYAMSDIEPALDWPVGSRSFARGRRVYHELGCHRCHVTSEHDTLVGPNLDGADYKPPRRELAEAIIAPDKQIAENYRQYLLVVNGKPITGLVTEQTDDYLIVIADPMHDCTPQRIERDQLDDEPERLTTSAMPTGMVDVLSLDELLDLLAYVEAKSDQKNAAFRQQVTP